VRSHVFLWCPYELLAGGAVFLDFVGDVFIEYHPFLVVLVDLWFHICLLPFIPDCNKCRILLLLQQLRSALKIMNVATHKLQQHSIT
jgi:hypothetical protein